MKRPIEGTVAYVSKAGREIRLAGDPKRYRGVKMRSILGDRIHPIAHLASRGEQSRIRVSLGDTVRMHWGGFADLNIRHVEILD